MEGQMRVRPLAGGLRTRLTRRRLVGRMGPMRPRVLVSRGEAESFMRLPAASPLCARRAGKPAMR